MDKLVLFISIILLVMSCADKPAPKRNKYYVSINADEIQLTGGLSPEVTADTVMAVDELMAFKNAMRKVMGKHEAKT